VAVSPLAGWIVVSLDEVARRQTAAERTHIIAEGAAARIAAALSGRAGTGKVAAAVSGGNIDL
jgi:threonine dehydratase